MVKHIFSSSVIPFSNLAQELKTEFFYKQQLSTVNSAYKPHPKFSNLDFGKKNLKEIKIEVNQKWSLDKDVLHVNALFLQVSCTCQPAY